MKFEEALTLVLHYEGGYSDHPQDPGGATNHGITHKTLARWRGVPSVTKEDVKNLTKEEAAAIYRADYWNKVKGDELPGGVDLMAFDTAVNMGVGRAVQFLQEAAGVKVDKIIGPKTLQAVRTAGPKLVEEVAARRAVHYAKLNSTFHLGWYRRLMSVFHLAVLP